MRLSTLRKFKLGLQSSSNDENSRPPPSYNEATSSTNASNQFTPTSQLQVQATGYDSNQALTGRTLENIFVYRVESGEAEYISLRLKRNSNSCVLLRAADPSQRLLISTIYRIGPGRHPRMRILHENSGLIAEDAINNHENMRGELVDVKSRSMISRTQVFDTSLGKFKWRYGDSKERDTYNANSLFVMERIDGGGGPKGGTRVAQLIRNDEYGTPGTTKYMGGNGGRLMIDLRMWQEKKSSTASEMEAFVVASSILMLKREADRFIDNNIAAVV